MPLYMGEKLQRTSDSGGRVPEAQVGGWDGEERRQETVGEGWV